MRNLKPMYENFAALYLSGKSGKEIAAIHGFKSSNTVRQCLKRMGILRTMSEASSLAVKQGKKAENTRKMIVAAKTTHRFNPGKFPWKGKPHLHPKWVKDRSKLKFQRSRTELREWRKAVFLRDDYTCQVCGNRGGKLNAHHIKSYVLYPDLREDVGNGRTLCEPCHKKTPNYGAKAKKYPVF